MIFSRDGRRGATLSTHSSSDSIIGKGRWLSAHISSNSTIISYLFANVLAWSKKFEQPYCSARFSMFGAWQCTRALTCVSYTISISNQSLLAAFKILQYLYSGPRVTVNKPFAFEVITRNLSRHGPPVVLGGVRVTTFLWPPPTAA